MKNKSKIIIIAIIVILIVATIKIKNKIEYNNFPKIEELKLAKKINKDTVGWIYIPKTNINYPVMYKENNYYLNYSFENEKATSGSVFTSNENKNQNISITGHNSRVSVSKLYWLHNIKDINLGLNTSCYEINKLSLNKQDMPNFENKKDRIWYVSIFGITGKWEVWAMYETSPDESKETFYYNTWTSNQENHYPLKTKDDINKWIDFQINKSTYNFNVRPTYQDQFLTIYTCSCKYYEEENESRLYFFLKKID